MRTPPSPPERLVQDIWQGRRFDVLRLATTAGEPVRLLVPGRPNDDVGPDFVGARVRVGRTEWAGGVEVHVASGGWYDHRHHEDPRYNSVVLHVTLAADIWTGTLRRADGSLLPEVVLEPLLDAPLRTLLHAYYTREAGDIPCAGQWAAVPDAVRVAWIDALADERADARDARIRRAAAETSLEEVLYRRLLTGLGYAKNADAMATLARHVPLALARRLEAPEDVEALLFGVAGLLPSPADLLQADRATADYAMALRDRFERLQHRLGPPVMDGSSWRFFRLRPANFPPLRIAQAAALLSATAEGLLHREPLPRLLAALRTDEPMTALRGLLRAPLPKFWRRHVRLDRACRPHDPTLGRPRADALLVNAVLPVLHVYSGQHGEPQDAARLAEVAGSLPAESDEVTRRFAALGTRAGSAWEAQGIHQLYRAYCREARCLSCDVGRHLLGGRP